jgi:hypothetical protein
LGRVRRDFLKATGRGAAALTVGGLMQACAGRSRPINVVLIMADDLGWEGFPISRFL